MRNLQIYNYSLFLQNKKFIFFLCFKNILLRQASFSFPLFAKMGLGQEQREAQPQLPPQLPFQLQLPLLLPSLHSSQFHVLLSTEVFVQTRIVFKMGLSMRMPSAPSQPIGSQWQNCASDCDSDCDSGFNQKRHLEDQPKKFNNSHGKKYTREHFNKHNKRFGGRNNMCNKKYKSGRSNNNKCSRQ